MRIVQWIVCLDSAIEVICVSIYLRRIGLNVDAEANNLSVEQVFPLRLVAAVRSCRGRPVVCEGDSFVSIASRSCQWDSSQSYSTRWDLCDNSSDYSVKGAHLRHVMT
jgi:hypothetical protein